MEIGNRRFASLKRSRRNGGAEIAAGKLNGRRGTPDVHEGGKIFVRAAERVGNPAPERRMIKLASAMAGAGFDDGGKVIALVAPHGADDGDVVDHAADVGEPVGNRNAGLAMALEGAQAGNHRALHLGEVVAEADGVDELSRVPVVLGVEGVDVADASAHEEKDDGLGLRLTEEGLGNFLRLSEDAAQSQPEKSTADLVDETAARVAAAWIGICVTEHK